MGGKYACSGTRSTCLEFVPNRIETLVVKSKKSISGPPFWIIFYKERRMSWAAQILFERVSPQIHHPSKGRENEIFPANNGFGPIP